MKKFLSFVLLGTVVFSFAGCGENKTVTIKKENIPVGYEATYYVVNTDKNVEYENKYSVTEENGKLIISSVAEIDYENAKGETGKQKMTAESTLNFSDEKLLGMPEIIEEEFEIDIDKTQYTAFTFEHDHALKSGLITTKRYDEDEEGGLKQKVYSVSLREQYFDKDSLPFLLGGFEETEGVIYVSAGNRDRLQAIKYEFVGTDSVTIKDGTIIECKQFLLRPNSMFGQSSATIWISQEGKPVKIVNGNSTMVAVEKGN